MRIVLSGALAQFSSLNQPSVQVVLEWLRLIGLGLLGSLALFGLLNNGCFSSLLYLDLWGLLESLDL